MATLNSNDNEANDLTGYDKVVGGVTKVFTSTASAMAGTYGLEMVTTPTGNARRVHLNFATPSSDIVHCAFRFNPQIIEQDSSTDSAYTILARDQGQRLSLRLYATGSVLTENLKHELRLKLDDGTVAISSGNHDMAVTDTEHLVEFEVYYHATAGYIKLWIDGEVAYQSMPGETDAGTKANSMQFGIRCDSATDWDAAQSVYFDDITITDTAGLVLGSVGSIQNMGVVDVAAMSTVASGNLNATHDLNASVSSASAVSPFLNRLVTALFRCDNEGIVIPTPDSGGEGQVKNMGSVSVSSAMSVAPVSLGVTSSSPLTAPVIPWAAGYPSTKKAVVTTPTDFDGQLGPWLFWDQDDLDDWKQEIIDSPSGVRATIKSGLQFLRTNDNVEDGYANERALEAYALLFGLETGTTQDTIGMEIYGRLDALSRNLDWEGDGTIDRDSSQVCLKYCVALNAIETWLVTDGHEEDNGWATLVTMKNRVAREAMRHYSSVINQGVHDDVSGTKKNIFWARQYRQNHASASFAGFMWASAFLSNITSQSEITQEWADQSHGNNPSGSGTDNLITIADLGTMKARAVEEWERVHYTYGSRPDGAGYEGSGYSTNMISGGGAWTYALWDRIFGTAGANASQSMYMFPVYLAYSQAVSGWNRREVPVHGDIGSNWWETNGPVGCLRYLAKNWATVGGDAMPVANACQWMADRMVASTATKWPNGNGMLIQDGRRYKAVTGWAQTMSPVLEFVYYDSTIAAISPADQTVPWPTYWRAEDLDIIISRPGTGWDESTGYQLGMKNGMYGKHQREQFEAAGFDWWVGDSGTKARGQWNNRESGTPAHTTADSQTDEVNGDPGWPDDIQAGVAHVHSSTSFNIFGAAADKYFRAIITGKQAEHAPHGRRMDNEGLIGVSHPQAATGYDGSTGHQSMRGVAQPPEIIRDGVPVYVNDLWNYNKATTGNQENLDPHNVSHDREDFDTLGTVGTEVWCGSKAITYVRADHTDNYTQRSKESVTPQMTDTRSVDLNISDARRHLFFSPATGCALLLDILKSSDVQTWFGGFVGYPDAAATDSTFLKVPCGDDDLYVSVIMKPSGGSVDSIQWDTAVKLYPTQKSVDNSTGWALDGKSGSSNQKFACNRVVYTSIPNEQVHYLSFSYPTTGTTYQATKPTVTQMVDSTTKTGVRVTHSGGAEQVYLVGHHTPAGEWTVTEGGETYTVNGSAAHVRKTTNGGAIEELMLADGILLKEGSTEYISTTNTHQCISVAQAGNTLNIDAYKAFMDQAPTTPERFTVDTGNGLIDTVNVNGVSTAFAAGIRPGTSFVIG